MWWEVSTLLWFSKLHTAHSSSGSCSHPWVRSSFKITHLLQEELDDIFALWNALKWFAAPRAKSWGEHYGQPRALCTAHKTHNLQRVIFRKASHLCYTFAFGGRCRLGAISPDAFLHTFNEPQFLAWTPSVASWEEQAPSFRHISQPAKHKRPTKRTNQRTKRRRAVHLYLIGHWDKDCVLPPPRTGVCYLPVCGRGLGGTPLPSYVANSTTIAGDNEGPHSFGLYWAWHHRWGSQALAMKGRAAGSRAGIRSRNLTIYIVKLTNRSKWLVGTAG